MKIIRRSSYILYTFTLLFITVNAHGDLFVRTASNISSKDCVMVLYLHVKLQGPSSVAIVWQKEMVYIVIIIIINYIVQSFSCSTVAIDMHGNSSLSRALSIENNFHVSPYLQLQCRDNIDAARLWLR